MKLFCLAVLLAILALTVAFPDIPEEPDDYVPEVDVTMPRSSGEKPKFLTQQVPTDDIVPELDVMVSPSGAAKPNLIKREDRDSASLFDPTASGPKAAGPRSSEI